MQSARATFDTWRAAMLGLTVTGAKRGYGSCLLLDFGELTPVTPRPGSRNAPTGAFSAMIEWSWRIEDERSIVCGSFSDEAMWDAAFAALVGRRIVSVDLFSRLPELDIGLEGGGHVLSFMTAEGGPCWTLFRKTGGDSNEWLHVEQGPLTLGRS